MYIPTRPVDIDPVTDFNAADEALARVFEGSLPVFVLHSAGTSRSYIEQRFAPIVAAHGFEFRDTDDQISISEAGGMGDNAEPDRNVYALNEGPEDFFPHFDYPPQPLGSRVTDVNFHLTLSGVVRGSFYRLSQAFLDSGDLDLPFGFPHELKNGQTLDRVVNPDYQRALLRAGSLAVFRTGGHSPIMHHFETVEAPRNSFVLRAAHADSMLSSSRR